MPSDELHNKDIQTITVNLERLEKTMESGFDKVNNRLDIMNDHFIRKDFFDEKVANFTEDIAELKDTNKWLARTVGGIIIVAIVSGIMLVR